MRSARLLVRVGWGRCIAKRVVFSSSRKQTFDLYLKARDGAQEEKAIEAAPAWDKYPSSWSRDGKYILYTRETELWFLTLPDLRTNYS